MGRQGAKYLKPHDHTTLDRYRHRRSVDVLTHNGISRYDRHHSSQKEQLSSQKVRRTKVQKDKFHPLFPALTVSGLGAALNAVAQQAQGTRIMSDTERCHGGDCVGSPRTDNTRGTVDGHDRR